MTTHIDRRTFIKATAMAAAVAAAHGLTASLPRACAGPPALDGTTTPSTGRFVQKAPCRFCGTGCHVSVTVEEGRVVAIEGDKLAPVNKGELCVKGYNVGQILYGNDRLTTPLLRKNGKLEPISWDEAIDVIAQRVFKAPDRFAIYGSGQWTIPEGYICNKLMKGGLQNNHIDPNARHCMASAVTGFLGVYGVDEPANTFDDLEKCNVLLLWGNNPAEMHPMVIARIMKRMDAGEKIRVYDIGTRTTRSTQALDATLVNMEPHGDLAIANGIAHLLVKSESYDKQFVQELCNFKKPTAPQSLHGQPSTWDEYVKSLEPYTPDAVSKMAGVPAEQIRQLAGEFADPANRIVSMWCMGMNQHTRGHAINTMVHSIHLLSGHWGKLGDGPMSLTGQPSACGTVREVGTLAHALPGGMLVANADHRTKCEHLWNLPEGRINGKPGFHTVKMWEEFCKPDGAIDTMWVQVTNPGQTLPNLNKLFNKEGMASENKFLIVSDVYPTATTVAANLVLPSALWVEKNGVFGNSERRTQQWFRMVEPPGEARDDVWQVLAVARKLHDMGHPGLKDKDGKFLFQMQRENGEEVPAWTWEGFRSFNVDRALFEEYRPFTHVKHKNVAPYDQLVTHRGMRWPVVEKDGVWHDTDLRFVKGHDPFVATGADAPQFVFYHSSTGDNRAQIWFNPYEPPEEVTDGDYPYWLCTGRVLEHWHSGTMTMRVKSLRGAMPEAYVEVNPDDARGMGVAHGDTVELQTRRGTMRLLASVNGRAVPKRGHLFVPFFDERLLINELTLDAHCPVSKQPDYKKCACRIRRIG